MKVLTVVQARLPAAEGAGIERAYTELRNGPATPGLVQSRLLRKPDGTGILYRIETIWESREMLDRMRAGPEPPAAIKLFHDAGTQPSFEVFEVAEELVAVPDRSILVTAEES